VNHFPIVLTHLCVGHHRCVCVCEGESASRCVHTCSFAAPFLHSPFFFKKSITAVFVTPTRRARAFKNRVKESKSAERVCVENSVRTLPKQKKVSGALFTGSLSVRVLGVWPLGVERKKKTKSVRNLPARLTLNLQPSTLNPQPSTLNLSTLNPQPSTLNPQP
jgi:hypothetical protein